MGRHSSCTGRRKLVEREKRRSRHGKKEMGREAREGGLGLITLCNVMGIALGGPS